MAFAMSTILERTREQAKLLTAADIYKRFGAIPMWRIRTDPPPGTATEDDARRIEASADRPCELIDGILLEKTVGYDESLLAGALIELLRRYVRPKRLGAVAGEAGTLKLAPGLVQIPDVSFVSAERLRGGKRPRDPIPYLVPDLAVEVLSLSNTAKEMQRKLVAYFDAGVRLVWFVEPRKRTVEVYTAPKARTVLRETDTLTGGEVLPGLEINLKELFAELDEV
jgi:Uma2 family endonuclease